MMAVYIVIPAYQEEKKVSHVVEAVVAAGYKNIVVVDDGSTDATSKNALRTGVRVLRHPLNRGKGAATRTGIEAARKLGADIIVTMDADGQHNPMEISSLVLPISKGECEVVLGTRKLATEEMPWYKIIQNKIANAITLLYAGIHVRDSQSGFRAYSRRASKLLDTKSDTYEYESEVIRLIAHHKLPFLEVPISVSYTPYSTGKPHKQNIVNGIKTVYKMIWNALT